MISNRLCADIPFSTAQQYINVNPFGSNVIVRVTNSYIEIDIWGKNMPLPGARKLMRGKTQDEHFGARQKSNNPMTLTDCDAEYTARDRGTANQKQKNYRARMNARDLRLVINQNFDPLTARMLTVTFADTNIPFGLAEERFKRLLKELQRKYQMMKFVSVIEPHANGCFHMHVVVNQPLARTIFDVHSFIKTGRVKNKRAALSYLWPHGMIHLKSLDNGGNLGACLAHYLTKRNQCTELEHKYGWRRSRNLEWYQTLRSTDALEVIRTQRLGNGVGEYYSYFCPDLDYVESVRHYEFCLNPEKVLLYGPRGNLLAKPFVTAA